MSVPEEEGPPESEPWTVTGWDLLVTGWDLLTRHGSIVLLDVEDPHGVAHVIAVDARPAVPIIQSYESGDVVLIQAPEPWQILSTFDAHTDEPPLSEQPDPDREED